MIIRRFSDWPTWDWRSPFDQLERMRRDLDRLAGDFSGNVFKLPSAGVFPLLNVTEDQNNYYVRAELPGVKTDELDISVTGETLTLSGERKLPEEGEKASYHRREREAGSFSRVISLPARLDVDKVKAHAEDGVLTVVLPKAESAKPRQISVKSS
ncbi:MAG: Hsp20/alpha crystallin family protein [Desulfobacterota bacterium]|jgi:HSP20 family protein|nr:Hsp20/alpha crystallin family protein [Thermodesulfobacteriota bacterium]